MQCVGFENRVCFWTMFPCQVYKCIHWQSFIPSRLPVEIWAKCQRFQNSGVEKEKRLTVNHAGQWRFLWHFCTSLEKASFKMLLTASQLLITDKCTLKVLPSQCPSKIQVQIWCSESKVGMLKAQDLSEISLAIRMQCHSQIRLWF